MKVDLSSYNNHWYKPGAVVKRVLWHYINTVFFNNGWFPFYGIKVFWLKLFGAVVGKNVLIKPFVNIKYPWLLSLGDNVWIGEQVWIDNLALVTIGNNVCISQGALLLCGNHNYSKATFDLSVKPIQLKDGVWLCAKVIITGGVVCEEHAVVSTGVVMHNNADAFGVYAGNPPMKIKERKIN